MDEYDIVLETDLPCSFVSKLFAGALCKTLNGFALGADVVLFPKKFDPSSCMLKNKPLEFVNELFCLEFLFLKLFAGLMTIFWYN